MSDIHRIAVLDIGKTNAKLVIVDTGTGVELAERRMRNRILPGPPYPHYDIEGLWRFACDALAAFGREPGYDAISITTHGAAAVLVDADGQAALPALDYEHTYPEEIRDAYAAIRPSFAETFSPALSGGLNLGAQLHYQKTLFPRQFAQVRTILTYPQYWAFRLTGTPSVEVTSLGCHTDLWRPREGCYSRLVEDLSIQDRLPPLRSAFDILGETTAEVTSSIGLEAPVPVFCGIHDSNASLLPHLIDREAPFSVVSTGTWIINFAIGGHLDGLDPARDTLANVDAYGRAVPSSRFMGGREFELLTEELGPLDPCTALAAMPDVLAGRLMLLPNLTMGSGPFPGRRGGWIGRGGTTSTEECWATACLYLALMTETCLALPGARGPVLVEGPFAANPAYLQALRALLGREVIAIAGSTGTTQGAALLAGTSPGRASGLTVSPPGWVVDDYRNVWHSQIAGRSGAGAVLGPGNRLR